MMEDVILNLGGQLHGYRQWTLFRFRDGLMAAGVRCIIVVTSHPDRRLVAHLNIPNAQAQKLTAAHPRMAQQAEQNRIAQTNPWMPEGVIRVIDRSDRYKAIDQFGWR